MGPIDNMDEPKLRIFDTGCSIFLVITFGELLIIQDQVSSIKNRLHKAAGHRLSSQIIKQIYATFG